MGFFLYLYVRDYDYLLNPPVSLKPVPRLCNIGKVERPASIFNPVTPMDIGELDLVNPEIFPNDKVPHGLVAEPVVAIPTTLVVDRTLQVSIPAFATLEKASTLYTLFKNVVPIPTVDELCPSIEVIPNPVTVSDTNILLFAARAEILGCVTKNSNASGLPPIPVAVCIPVIIPENPVATPALVIFSRDTDGKAVIT